VVLDDGFRVKFDGATEAMAAAAAATAYAGGLCDLSDAPQPDRYLRTCSIIDVIL